ncbi:MAG: hypothetical protein QXG73_03315 [Candidatus Micrarchaeaceae archaeon]
MTYASSEKDITSREIESLLYVAAKLRCKKLTIVTWEYEASKDFSKQRVDFVPLWRWLLQ